MKQSIRYSLIGLMLLIGEGLSGQTLRQFSGRVNISTIDFLSASEYTIKGAFSDQTGFFNASNAAAGDHIIDNRGNSFEVIDVTASASNITAKVKVLNAVSPAFGIATIYRPTESGIPLLTNEAPDMVLVNTLNSAALTIDAKIPKYLVGSVLPSSSFSAGDVVKLTTDSKIYTLSGTGWSQVSEAGIPTTYVANAAAVPPGNKGDMVKLFFESYKIYVYDGSAWKAPDEISSLPTPSKYGDIFFVTGENRLYIYDPENKWVTLGGSRPGSSLPPASDSKPGDTFYNTADNTFYVYNGSQWVPLGNVLAEGKIFMGNSAGIAEGSDISTIKLSQFGVPDASLAMGGNAVTGLANPTAAQDAATKSYVDTKTIEASSISLVAGSLLVGDATGKAEVVAKNTISISELGAPTGPLAMGGNAMTGLAEPSAAQDAATKNYVDTKPVDAGSIPLAAGNILIGDSDGNAVAASKSSIFLSDLGAPQTDVSIGGKALNDLAEPVLTQDAATKNYVDTKFENPEPLALAEAQILVGSAAGIAFAVSLSGDVKIDNAGLTMIQPESVDASKIKEGSISTAKLQDGSVSLAKLASSGAADADKVYVTDSAGVPSLVDRSSFTSGSTGAAETFADNFVVNGVPNYLKWTNGQTVPAKGKTAVELLLEGSQMAVSPAYQAPTASLTSNPAAGDVELGKNLGTITLNASFTQRDAGTVLTTVYSKNDVPISGNTDIVSNVTGPIKYTVTYSYSEGGVKNNNLGAPDPTGRIVAGSISRSITFNPTSPRYYGFVSSTNPADSEVRTLAKDQTASKTLKTIIQNPSVAKYLCFRYPVSAGTVTSIKVNGFAALGAFTITQSSFTNENGYSSNYYLIIGNNPVDNSGASSTDIDIN